MKEFEEPLERLGRQIDDELDAIAECIDELKGILVDTKEHVQQQRAEREAAIKERWTFQKKVSALERINAEYDAVVAENNRLRADRDRVRESLHRIQACARALISEYRS